MKNFIYPAVVYSDKESGWFTVTIPDVHIVTEGETMEKAYLSAKKYLTALVEAALRFECVLDEPSSFAKLYKQKKPNSLIIFIDASVK